MSVSGGPDIITEGLVLHLDAANTESYPGSGGTWYDLSNNGNHCTVSNPSSYSTNKMGSLDRLIGCGLANLDITDITIEVVVNNLTGGGIATKGYINNTEFGLSVGYTPSRIVARPYHYHGQLTYTPSTLSGLHFIAYTAISNGNTVLYYNGVSVASRIISSAVKFSGSYSGASNSGLDLELGYHRYNSSSGVSFGGKYHCFKLYDRALSESEVLQNYNATRSRYGL